MAHDVSWNIGILALHEHQNYFANLYKILDYMGASITVFAPNDYKYALETQRNNHNINWIELDVENLTLDLTRRVSRICSEELDLLFIFPSYGIIKSIARIPFNPNCKTVQFIYNVNLWTMNNLSLTPRIHQYLDLAIRRSLLYRIDAALVEYTPMKKHLDQLSNVNSFSYAPILHEEPQNVSSEATKTLTVPGHIDTERRDYSTILDAIEFNLENLSERLTIQLLGRPVESDGERIIERCNSLEKDGWNIDYYTDWIPFDKFSEKLRQSDLIVAPLRETKQVYSVTERYGVSKATGAFGDAIRYGTPLMLPDHYMIPEEVEPIVNPYGGPADFSETAMNLLKTSSDPLEEYKRVLTRYDIRSQSNELQKILKSII